MNLSKVFDFSFIFVNKEVLNVVPGMQIGELALLNNEPRAATVRTRQPCLFGYLERDEYKNVLQRAQERDIHKKLSFLKEFRFFEDVSTSKLNKLLVNMKHFKLSKGHILFREGEVVTGIYVVQKGTLKYMKRVPYRQPISSKTKNKWFVEQAKIVGANKKEITR
jgi:CRP-like cAMP-binding protein